MLIRVSFRDLLQAAVYLLICSWHYATPSQFVQEMYSIYRSLCFLQVLAMYKKVKPSQSRIKVLFCIGSFPLTYSIT